MVLGFSVPKKIGTVYSKGGSSLGFCRGQKVWLYVHVCGFFQAFHRTKPEPPTPTQAHLFLLTKLFGVMYILRFKAVDLANELKRGVGRSSNLPEFSRQLWPDWNLGPWAPDGA